MKCSNVIPAMKPDLLIPCIFHVNNNRIPVSIPLFAICTNILEEEVASVIHITENTTTNDKR